MAEPVNFQVLAETRSLKIQSFIQGESQITTGKLWDEWLEELEREFRYFRITEAQDKKDAMIIYGGKDIARLSKSLPDPTEEDLDAYAKLKKKLNDYFKPQQNKHHARYLFLKMRPNSDETTSAYAARLREKAAECDFEANADERI